jgi:uncharacterized protein
MVTVVRTIIWCCAAGVLTLAPARAGAQITVVPGVRVDRPARSMKDARDRNVVKQRFDFSCGAAALATLLRFGIGEPVTERDILTQLYGLLSDDETKTVRRTGFSLLHLQRVAQARGYHAEGFRLGAEQLALLPGPVLVFIQPRGYKHFAVLRGVQGDRVYLADPSRGNIRVPIHTFLDQWRQDDGRGVIFVVEPAAGLPDAQMPLALMGTPPSPPEIMTAREMLAIGGSLVRLNASPAGPR